MGRAKKLLRRIMPLRTSTFLYHHDADARKIKALIGTSKSMLGEAKAARGEAKAALGEAKATLNEVLSQLRAISARLDGLENRQRSLHAEVMRNQRFLNETRRKQDEYLDPELYAHALKLWYLRVTGHVLDLSNPRTFNEKIQWAKVYDKDPRRSLLADKINVREYVKESVGEKYLVPLINIWHSAKDIDFDALPNSFVLKANHGCGYNAIVRDKETEDVDALRRKANSWMHEDFAYRNGFEMQYQGIDRRLFAEQYLENIDGDMPDYKFWCFDGNVHYIQYLSNRSRQLTMTFFDVKWNVMPFVYDYPRHEHAIDAPEQLDEMIQVAETLSKGFPHVRVDLYLLDSGEVKFSELTFTSASGACSWDPPEANLMLGNLYQLPQN